MNDTSPGIEKKYVDLIMSKTPEERLKMGFSMFDAARAIVVSAIVSDNPGISAKDLKEQIFLRFYGSDFNEDQKKRIVNCLVND